MTILELCDIVRETAYAIHLYHGHGHLEKVYENALAHRLRKSGLSVRQQEPLTVYDEDDTPLGQYFADLWIENRLIVELRACRDLTEEHTAQLLGYLKGTSLNDFLLEPAATFGQVRRAPSAIFSHIACFALLLGLGLARFSRRNPCIEVP
jgi:GxxExxY protein